MVSITSDWMGRSYDRYFQTGFYEQRYPGPNPATLRLALEQVGIAGPRVVDFGCGSGRYARALLEHSRAQVIGYDLSPVALERLRRACAAHVATGRLLPLGGDLDALATAVAARDGIDLALLLFGVLGHVPGRDARRRTLRALHAMLRPAGRLVLSVPNARQRFHRERLDTERLVDRSGLEPGDIVYTRRHNGDDITLYYHLYDAHELACELRECGFRLLQLHAESVLPERAVVTSPLAACLDRLLAAALPLSRAYGFLAVAEAA
jgi:SAM-dependent methyltransferase